MHRAVGLVAIGLALVVASPVMATQLHGVVEGYYGRPWSGDARRDVIRFMGAHGMDTFVYGPKNDPYHRDRWREPYPAEALADLTETARVARRARVRFVYALSPGLDVCYACRDDFAALAAKLGTLARARIRHVALFFDDVFGGLTHPADVKRYGGTDGEALARAHADLVNRTDRWLRRRGGPGIILMVPSDYAGTACHPYHDVLARRLRPGIAIGWTGTGVFAPTLTGAAARAFRTCVRGRPVVLWDNVPVNDTLLANNLHLGPLTGRDATLARELRGHLLNPMTEAHASLVTIGTAAAYFADPSGYDPEAAWRATLAELDPGGGLAVLAEQVRSSPIDLDDARELAAVTGDVAMRYLGADWEPAMAALDTEIARQAAAPAAIATSLGGTPLGSEIAPWVAELAAHVASAADAIALLRAMKPAFTSLDTIVAAGTLAISGRVVPPDDGTIAALGPLYATLAPVPTLGTLLGCLGPGFLTADIHFCPELGLNVHGKAFAFIPYSASALVTVTGRNVHRNFLAFVAERYADYTARESAGSDALTVTVDGASVALAVDGTFATSLPSPASGHVTVQVTTAAGDATSRAVP